MTAKQFLRRYRDTEQSILSKERRIELLKYKALGQGITLTARVQGSSQTQESMALAVEAYSDIQADLQKEIQRLRAIQREILEVINLLEDGRHRNVLELYYIEGLTLENVAVKLNYSYMQICRLHGKALEKVKDVIKCYIKM